MANRTTSLDSKDLEVTIEVLSSAAHALQLTRFQRLSYWALMVSIDVAIVVAVAIVSLIMLVINGWFVTDLEGIAFLIIVAFTVFGLSLVVWIVLLALNIPLFRKASRERARLKELGLDSLSQSLWKESQRSRWRSRAHGALIIVIGVIFLLMTLADLALSREWDISNLLIALYCVASAGLLFCAQYLRNQRERMDLTASAEKLRKSLQSLQQRAGEARVVSVPSELLETDSENRIGADFAGPKGSYLAKRRLSSKGICDRIWSRRRPAAGDTEHRGSGRA